MKTMPKDKFTEGMNKGIIDVRPNDIAIINNNIYDIKVQRDSDVVELTFNREYPARKHCPIMEQLNKER